MTRKIKRSVDPISIGCFYYCDYRIVIRLLLTFKMCPDGWCLLFIERERQTERIPCMYGTHIHAYDGRIINTIFERINSTFWNRSFTKENAHKQTVIIIIMATATTAWTKSAPGSHKNRRQSIKNRWRWWLKQCACSLQITLCTLEQNKSSDRQWDIDSAWVVPTKITHNAHAILSKRLKRRTNRID